MFETDQYKPIVGSMMIRSTDSKTIVESLLDPSQDQYRPIVGAKLIRNDQPQRSK